MSLLPGLLYPVQRAQLVELEDKLSRKTECIRLFHSVMEDEDWISTAELALILDRKSRSIRETMKMILIPLGYVEETSTFSSGKKFYRWTEKECP